MVATPTRPYRLLRALVGTGIIAAVVGLWIHARLIGEPLGTLWEVVMLALVIAAGYAVFGHRTMTQAVEDARDLSGEGETEDEDA
jgi:uncharacterized membrane protein